MVVEAERHGSGGSSCKTTHLHSQCLISPHPYKPRNPKPSDLLSDHSNLASETPPEALCMSTAHRAPLEGGSELCGVLGLFRVALLSAPSLGIPDTFALPCEGSLLALEPQSKILLFLKPCLDSSTLPP